MYAYIYQKMLTVFAQEKKKRKKCPNEYQFPYYILACLGTLLKCRTSFNFSWFFEILDGN